MSAIQSVTNSENSTRICCCPAPPISPSLTPVLSLLHLNLLLILRHTHTCTISITELYVLSFLQSEGSLSLSLNQMACARSMQFFHWLHFEDAWIFQSLARDQQQGYLVVSLFAMIDLMESFLSSAWEEDHLADLLLWLITLEVSSKDLSAWHVSSTSEYILRDICTLIPTWNRNCLKIFINGLHCTDSRFSIYCLVIAFYPQRSWQSGW